MRGVTATARVGGGPRKLPAWEMGPVALEAEPAAVVRLPPELRPLEPAATERLPAELTPLEPTEAERLPVELKPRTGWGGFMP